MKNMIDTLIINESILIEKFDSIKNIASADQTEIANILNQLNSNNNFTIKDIHILIIGVILGGIVSYLVTVFIDSKRKRRKLNKYNTQYNRYSGIYLEYDKYNMSKIHHMLRIEVKENVFIINNGYGAPKSQPFSGKILLNDQNPFYGTGYYHHERDHMGFVGFGFLKIQLAENKILVHTEYYKNGKLMPYPRIWIKQEDYDLKKFIIKFNRLMKEQIDKEKNDTVK